MEHLTLGFLAAFSVAGGLALIKTLLFFVILIFVLVTVHEFGHFIAGRIFGMHVPVFSVGMGRRLLGWNKINGFTTGPLAPEVEIQLGANTDYRLSILPLGGYAKIDGMIDETQTEALPADIKPWEFRAKPWWQKSIVISAGVIMNVLLAWFIFGLIRFAYGEDIQNTTTVGYVESGSISQKMGVLPGDKIVAIDNKGVANWKEVEEGAFRDHTGEDFVISYSRAGHHRSIIYHAKDMGSIAKPEEIYHSIGLIPVGYTPPSIAAVTASNPADHLGLKPNDIITRVNGDSIPNSISLTDHIKSHPNQEITVDWTRAGVPFTGKVKPDANGKIGIQIGEGKYVGPEKHISYGFGQAIAMGWNDLWTNLRLLAENIGKMFTGQIKPTDALGGPVKIAQMAGQSADAGTQPFITLMALLSISLAFLNILPIPALDGGHLVIILIEAAIGHELSQKFKMNFQKVGVALLLTLMIFMVFNDFRGL